MPVWTNFISTDLTIYTKFMREELISNLYRPLYVSLSQYFKFDETLWNSVFDKLFIMWDSLLIRQML